MPTYLNLAAYCFVAIDDTASLAAHFRQVFSAFRGTALVAPEGINLFLAGAPGLLRAAIETLQCDARFAAMDCKWSQSASLPFRKLLVKSKREIIRFDRPEIDATAQRAPAVDPTTLARWIAQGADDEGRDIVLLDTRNQQEIEHGTFAGAMTLPISRFTELPAAIEDQRAALQNRTIVSFCTGGIRCEKAALWMRNAGFDRVLQLDGGILGYFEKVGGFGYDRRCFVFDERVSLDAQLRAMDDGAHEPPG